MDDGDSTGPGPASWLISVRPAVGTSKMGRPPSARQQGRGAREAGDARFGRSV